MPISLFTSANSLSLQLCSFNKLQIYYLVLFNYNDQIVFSIKYLIYVSETAKATNKNAMESIDHKGLEKQWKTAGLISFFLQKLFILFLISYPWKIWKMARSIKLETK